MQLSLPFIESPQAISHFENGNTEERGAVFTKSEVVEFILDLVGYTWNQPLHTFRLLEPSFGDGDFLLPAVERLLTSYFNKNRTDDRAIEDLTPSVRAVEVHSGSIRTTRVKLFDRLRRHGISETVADHLLDAWIIHADFLLAKLPHPFTHTVGNPPYVRQELIPDVLLAEYRKRYSTIYDRADLYVPFIERGLKTLVSGGTLGFICADRWMKNKYGVPLRALVSRNYHLVCSIDMVDTPAFHSEVIAYPAITVIRREKPGPTRIAHKPQIERKTLAKLARAILSEYPDEDSGVEEVEGIAQGAEPWILKSFDQLAVVRRLEAEFPLIEEAGCKVGIGVATGADKVFIGPLHELDVEPDRKLSLVKTRDIEKGTVEWQGLGVINPFSEDGTLVDLAHYPRLARYLEKHAATIRGRNCARKNPKNWYRTIDRIYPALACRPKLLIPDIKGKAHVVLEKGHLYPHHNLYYITSDEWDLKPLQAVLMSGIAKLFVSMYSTRMRGGFLRFQAQYLRRIRLPRWKDVPEEVRTTLLAAIESGDTEACTNAAFDLYRLTPQERAAIGGNGNQETA